MIALLVRRSLQHDRVRLATAILGVAAAVGLLVWASTLTIATAAQSRIRATRMAAPATSWVTTVATPRRRGARPPATEENKKQKPTTPAATLPEPIATFHVTRVTLDYRPDGRVMQGPPLTAGLIVAPVTGCPYSDATLTGQWPDATVDEPLAAMCSSVFAQRNLPVPPLGTPITLLGTHGVVTVTLSAIIDRPDTAPGFPSIFATVAAIDILGVPPFMLDTPNLSLYATTPAGEDILRNATQPPARFLTCETLASEVATDTQNNFKRQVPLLLTLATLAAFCMLMHTLTIGMERQRATFARLRTLGMTATGTAYLILAEGLIIAFLGWLFGVIGGTLAVALFIRCTPETFPAGFSTNAIPALATFFGTALVSGIALLPPFLRARRIRPLDTTDDAIHIATPLRPWRGALGVTLLFPMLILVFPLPISPMVRSILILLIGIPLHILGAILALPTFILLIERFTTPPLAHLLHLAPTLLRHRISRTMHRTVGMTLTLAIGLATFIAIHIWGASLTAPFIPSKSFPDAIVSILPNGISDAARATLTAIPGVADNRIIPIRARQFALSNDTVSRITERRHIAPMVPNILLFGTDMSFPHFQCVCGGYHNLRTNDCVITSMFARETGFSINDTFSITANNATHTLRIAAIADLNWHLVTSRAQLRGTRGFGQATMGPVFVTEDFAKTILGTNAVTHLWLNMSREFHAMPPLIAGQRVEASIRETLGDAAADSTIRLHHRDEIADGTIAHSAQLIGAMARAPFWALAVLSTGFIALILASYQASAKEFATMRAIGMTRGQLARILLGEALLIGFCSIVLSLISGFCIGWTFTGWTRAWMVMFGGLPVTLAFPWVPIAQGIGFTIALILIVTLPTVAILTRRTRDNV